MTLEMPAITAELRSSAFGMSIPCARA
jgi:hypothetical protein